LTTAAISVIIDLHLYFERSIVMEKFIPFEKLSKKQQRAQNAKRRSSWYGLNPVTRKPENPKAYNRRKARKWSEDSMTVPFDFAYL